jgi:hypothetical protein
VNVILFLASTTTSTASTSSTLPIQKISDDFDRAQYYLYLGECGKAKESAEEARSNYAAAENDTGFSIGVLNTLDKFLRAVDRYCSVVVVANSIDGESIDQLIEYYNNRQYSVIRINASQFQSHKHYRQIVILGGQRAPEGIGELVGGILTPVEKSVILDPLSVKKKFVKKKTFGR